MSTLVSHQPSLAYAAVRSGSSRHAHTHDHYNGKDQGTAIGTAYGFVIGIYLATFTVPAATGAGGPGAGVAAAIATVGGSMAIGATLGGAIGTIVGEDGQDAPPAQSAPAQSPPSSPQGPQPGDQDNSTIGIGPFNTGGDSGTGQGGGPCFIAGTPVLLADGRHIPIETVQVGDLLASKDTGSGATESQPATHLFTHEVNSTLLLHLSNGTTLHTTKQHRFFVPGLGFVAAGRLTPGTALLTYEEQSPTVLGTTPLHEEATVYNLEIAGFHTYFVGKENFWVHNEKDEYPPD